MACSICCTSSSVTPSSEDCIETSLERIKKHYLYFKQVLDKKDKEICLIKERNRQLNEIISMLQRDKIKVSASQNISPNKKRKLNITNTYTIGSSSSDTSFNDDVAQTSKLNVALNSEHLFDCSSLNATVDDESIAETENVNGRSILRANLEHSAFHDKKLKENKRAGKSELSCNQQNREEFVNSWLAKDVSNQNEPEHTEFVKPLILGNIGGKKLHERKFNLSITKKNQSKLKQAHLQLDVLRETNLRQPEINRIDVINDSPKAHSSLNKLKASRSWMLRTSNNDTKDISSKTENNQIFDCSLAASENKSNNSKLVANAGNEIEFDITSTDITQSDELLAKMLLTEFEDKKSNDTSVLLLTPATQDVIFLDDTDTDGDFPQDSSISQDFNNTKNEKCQHVKDKPNASSHAVNSDIKIKQEILSELNDTKRLDETFVEELEFGNIKNEINKKISSAVQRNDRNIKKNNWSEQEKCTEESEEFMVRPIIIKEEKFSAELPNKQLSAKERFNIDCQECINYIEFLGDKLTDEQIMAHLRQCSRHKEVDALRYETPDGFWDPFIRSFDEKDPRNEVLIDTRFANRKQNK